MNDYQIAETISKQLSIPIVDCSNYSPSKELLSLVPKELAESKMIFPLEQKDKNLLIAMADPLDWQATDVVSFGTGLKLSLAVAPDDNILNAIESAYSSAGFTCDILKELPASDEAEFVKEEDIDKKHGVSYQALYKESEAPPIVKLVTMLIADAIGSNASDIHIEPRNRYVQVRHRIDGELKNIQSYPSQIHNSVISRIKIISNLDITNRRFPQDGRSALRLKGKTVDLRVSTLTSVYGEKIVIRLLDPSSGLVSLKNLGISDMVMAHLIDIFSKPQRMLLITGPTGSGKTTTLYSVLQQLQRETKNIITIEDPVEYKLKDITQVGINEAIGLTFAGVLRSVLRQDPDIVMVGEIRDLDTAEVAARAALTGHLVLSTLHTNDTISSLTRLIDIGLEPFLVNSAVSGVLAQRLIRKICPDCKINVPPPEEAGAFNLPLLKDYYKGAGCGKCNHTGYRGRSGVYEFVKMDTRLRQLISRRSTEDKLWECARQSGAKTLFEDAWSKIREGITTFEEVISKIHYQDFEIDERKHTGVSNTE